MDAAHKETTEKMAKELGMEADQVHPQNPVHTSDFKSVGAEPGKDEHINATVDTPLEFLGEGFEAAGSLLRDAKQEVAGGGTNYDDRLGNKNLIQSLKDRWSKKFPGKQIKERI